jgi:predicted GNAT family acetyltransferase
MNDTVSDNPAQQRYELAVDGHVAASYYEIADGVITFVHTEVPRRSLAARASARN